MCFSDSWVSPVMWAHYAEKHYGICLGFEIPERDGKPLALRVGYNDERLKFMLDRTKDLYGIDQAFIQALLCTKASEWAYEREYRCVADLTIHRESAAFHDLHTDVQRDGQQRRWMHAPALRVEPCSSRELRLAKAARHWRPSRTLT